MTRLLSTRFGALAVAALLAVAAVGIVLVYAHKYRSSVDNANGEVTVLVANRSISQYTPGSQVVDGSMFSTRQVPADAAVDGAVSNPDQLKGLVARSDIYPGEQLTTNQFVKSNTTSPTVKLTPDQRAVGFPVDAASGLVGQVQAGDRVDMVATFDVTPIGANGLPLTGAQPITLTKTIVSDALVLDAPAAPSSTDAGHSDPVLTLAIDVNDVQRALFAQEKGTIWFALRPPGSAENVKPTVLDVGAVLRGNGSAPGPVLRLTGAGR
jgi:pilus assembly protein CpaB